MMARTIGDPVVRPASAPSRRLTSRVEAPGDVWVYWKCRGREDVSQVRNMSMGGLFLQTRETQATGTVSRLNFLVAEGQIRADAEVRHVRPGAGLGLKFTALNDQDRPKLAALLTRLRRTQHPAGRS